MRSCQAFAGVAMLRPASSSSVVKKSRHKRAPQNDAAGALINRRRQKSKQGSCPWLRAYSAGLVLAALPVLLLLLQITTSGPFGAVEAKIHHSKRQVPITSFATPTKPSMTVATTGRENTNWWNVWWQQYIDEADQPTVRPIVGVTFNGRTINLSDQSVRSTAGNEDPSGLDGSGDVGNLAPDDSANSIGDSSPPLDQAQDLERSAMIQTAGARRQQVAARSGKSMPTVQQHQLLQGNWQNVRSTMLQPKAAAATAMRDSRPSRQAQQQGDEEPAQMQLGIQMRNTMNSQKRQPAQQLLPPPQPQQQPRWKQRQQLQQQQMQQRQFSPQQMPIEFEQQQQSQMVDYSEDGEPELEEGQLEGDQIRVPDQGQVRDSSSSSMMAGEQPSTAQVRPQDAGRPSTTVQPAPAGGVGAASGANREQLRPTNDASIEMRQPQQAAGRKQQQQPPAQKALPGQAMILIPGKRPMVAPKQPAAAPVPPTMAGLSTTAASADAASTGNSLGEQSSPATETSSPATTTIMSTTRAASTTSRPISITTTVDLNETPISLGNTNGQQAPATPGGRVALQNGRPATRQQPQATTTSARLPMGKTLSRTTPAQASTSSMGPAAEPAPTTTAVPLRSMAPLTTAQISAGSSPPTTATTSSSPFFVDSGMTTTGSPIPTTTAAAAAAASSMSSSTAGRAMAPVTTTVPIVMAPTGGASGAGESTETPEPPDSGGADEAEGDSGEKDSDEDGEEESEEEPTTTAKPTTTLTKEAGQQQASSSPQDAMPSTPAVATGAGSSMATAQQPSLATMDLERLPKGSSGTTSGAASKSLPTTQSMMTTGQPQLGSTSSAGSGATPAVDSTSRATSPAMTSASERPRAQDATRDEFSFMFMPGQAGQTTPTVVGGDTPITMPMDQLMRLMMGGQVTATAAMTSQEAATSPKTLLQDEVEGMTTTQQPLQTTTTTTAQTPTTTTSAQTTTASVASTSDGASSSLVPSTMTMPAGSMQAEVGGDRSSAGPEPPSLSPIAPTMNLAKLMEQEQMATNEMAGDQLAPGSRKRLQPPPPTTRAPGADQMMLAQQEREQPAATGAPPPDGSDKGLATRAPEVLATTTPQQRTVMLNLEREQPAPVRPGAAQSGAVGPMEGGGEEPKIELLNLDLVPIQRIMSQQQPTGATKAPDKTASKLDRLNMVGVQQSPGRQKSQQLKQQPATKPTLPADQLFTEVEPGMRLRPMSAQGGRTQMQPQQQPSEERANTVYMIMMSSPSPSESQPKQGPMTVVEMMPSSPGPAGAAQATRAQVPAPPGPAGSKQRGHVAGTKSAQAPSPKQQWPVTSTVGSMRPTSGQQKMTTPVLMSAAKRGQEKEGQQIMMMSALGALPTQPPPTTTTTTMTATMGGPKLPTLMENAIEMEMQMGAIGRQKDTVKMRKLNELPSSSSQTMMESMAKSTLPLATTTTAQAAPTTNGDQSIMTTTSSPMDAARLSTTQTTAIRSSQDSTVAPAALSTPSLALPSMTTTTAPSAMTTTSAAASPIGTTGGGEMTAAGVSSSAPTTEAPRDRMANRTGGAIEEEEGGGSGAFGARPAMREGAIQTMGDNNQQTQQAGGSVTFARPAATGEGGRSQQQFERIQQQPITITPATPAAAAVGSRTPTNGDRRSQQQQKTGVKTGRAGVSETSSFIPSRLRADFASSPAARHSNRTQLQMQLQLKPERQTSQSSAKWTAAQQPAQRVPAFSGTSENQDGTAAPAASSTLAPMAQNMAIRQFGGANRMSVLAKQPVPFGRPAAMTMQQQSPSMSAKSMQQPQQSRQQQQQQSRANRVEVPSFQYGPSIAVRRPDEPLANGQMPNCTLTGKNFCVLTKDYPMNEVRQAVERSFRSVRIMYEELQTVSDQDIHKDLINTNATNNQAASGQFACQTQVEMMRPGWAKDEITKEWMLVVNTDVFPQRVRTESCAQPNTPCEFIAPFYDSTCQQRYSLHRMIAIDPHDPSRSPQVAMFRFPAGCVCRVHPIKKFFTSTTTSQQTTTTTPVPSTTSSQRLSAK